MKTQETVLDVEGMSCPSCIRHVDAALLEIEGVAAVEVRLRQGKVVVRHDPEAAPIAALISALSEAGYPSTPSRAA